MKHKSLFGHLIFLAHFCLTLLTGEMLQSADSKQCCTYEGNIFQVPKTFFLIKRNSQNQREFDLKSCYLENSVLRGILLGLFLLFSNYMCVSVCGFVHTSASTNEGQNCWISGVMSHTVWVLRTEHGCSQPSEPPLPPLKLYTRKKTEMVYLTSILCTWGIRLRSLAIPYLPLSSSLNGEL